LLESVLAITRELGASQDLKQTLDVIASAVVEVLGFEATAVNVVVDQHSSARHAAIDDDDDVDMLEVVAVRGPASLTELLGTRRPLASWLRVFGVAEHWGRLRYIGHDQDQSVFDGYPSWTPDSATSDAADAWHPDDSLFAPMWDEIDGRLIGVISVDRPSSGRRPDEEQCTVLEMFATQAASAILDARAREAAEDHWRDAEARWELAFEHGPSGTAIVDTRGRIVRANEAFARMLGYSRDRLHGLSLREVCAPADTDDLERQFGDLIVGLRDRMDIEKRYLRANGTTAWARICIGAVRDENQSIRTIVAQIDDIDDRKVAEQRLAHQATHDWLTDLPNRGLLEHELTSCLAGSDPVGVLYCDLDRFKTVNDGLGHSAGDELLTEVARRWTAVLPDGWLLGRIGGDEFVVVAPGEIDVPFLRQVADAMSGALDEPVNVRGQRFTVAVSIGIAVSAPWHSHADEVLREADQALLRAKRHGRGRVEVYDADQDHPVTADDLRLEEALRNAVRDRRDLEPFFQPIVQINADQIVGWETLVRWRHPSRGLLSPEAFLPLAEQTGLIAPLGWWMLELGCEAANEPPVSNGWVAVNVSGTQLGRGMLVGAVDDALERSGLDPRKLRLEITESALVDASTTAISEVREVAARGVRVALDDFGTGYSSLTLLRDLPVSVVKIDRSFVIPAAHQPRTAAIVRGVVDVCDELGIDTVAEGVETEAQLHVVRDLGCTHAQGYLFGRPTPQPSRRTPD
jgi:diguanylate cyclase (GGDEF)-like protein/PAS domain S-box-containing protein